MEANQNSKASQEKSYGDQFSSYQLILNYSDWQPMRWEKKWSKVESLQVTSGSAICGTFPADRSSWVG